MHLAKQLAHVHLQSSVDQLQIERMVSVTTKYVDNSHSETQTRQHKAFDVAQFLTGRFHGAKTIPVPKHCDRQNRHIVLLCVYVRARNAFVLQISECLPDVCYSQHATARWNFRDQQGQKPTLNKFSIKRCQIHLIVVLGANLGSCHCMHAVNIHINPLRQCSTKHQAMSELFT